MNTPFKYPEKSYLPFVFFLILIGLAVSALPAHAGCVRDICLDLIFDKQEYKPGEKVAGKVVMNSRRPAMYPETVNVKIYKDDRLIHQLHTNIASVYPGRTELTLRPFGLSNLNQDPKSTGRWRVTLGKEVSGEIFSEAAFTVITDDLGPIELPPGFVIETYASDVPNARSMALSPRGTLFVGTRTEGKVYAVIDKNRDGKADKVVMIDAGLYMPNGVAYAQGDLYVAEVHRILKYPDIETRLDNPPDPVVLNDGFPKDRHHGWKYIAFGPDAWLYVPVGAPCNICEKEDERYASIMRVRPDGSQPEVFASGVRNTVGFAWHPLTQELWFTDNGRDWMGDDLPPDELNLASEKGMDFGFPYCHGTDVIDPDFGDEEKHPCNEYTPPVQELGPHVAALGMIFYTGKMFPEEYKNQILIAEHGSWNRSIPIGYRIMRVTLDGDRAVSYEPFAQGWLQGTKVYGRPVDIIQMEDGAILVSDDYRGVIYRISYRPEL